MFRMSEFGRISFFFPFLRAALKELLQKSHFESKTRMHRLGPLRGEFEVFLLKTLCLFHYLCRLFHKATQRKVNYDKTYLFQEICFIEQ